MIHNKLYQVTGEPQEPRKLNNSSTIIVIKLISVTGTSSFACCLFIDTTTGDLVCMSCG